VEIPHSAYNGPTESPLNCSQWILDYGHDDLTWRGTEVGINLSPNWMFYNSLWRSPLDIMLQVITYDQRLGGNIRKPLSKTMPVDTKQEKSCENTDKSGLYYGKRSWLPKKILMKKLMMVCIDNWQCGPPSDYQLSRSDVKLPTTSMQTQRARRWMSTPFIIEINSSSRMTLKLYRVWNWH
jgi:hypothetical protein